jgi:hypothetical protein
MLSLPRNSRLIPFFHGFSDLPTQVAKNAEAIRANCRFSPLFLSQSASRYQNPVSCPFNLNTDQSPGAAGGGNSVYTSAVCHADANLIVPHNRLYLPTIATCPPSGTSTKSVFDFRCTTPCKIACTARWPGSTSTVTVSPNCRVVWGSPSTSTSIPFTPASIFISASVTVIAAGMFIRLMPLIRREHKQDTHGCPVCVIRRLFYLPSPFSSLPFHLIFFRKWF